MDFLQCGWFWHQRDNVVGSVEADVFDFFWPKEQIPFILRPYAVHAFHLHIRFLHC